MSEINRSAPGLPARDLPAYLASYPNEVAVGDEPPKVVFDRYHTPDFVLVNDAMPMDRPGLLGHVRPMRRRVRSVEVTVHDMLRDGDRVAARSTLTAEMRRGTTIATEIAMYGVLAADGRLARVDQITRAHGSKR